ncbi:MAG: OmpH family outer membrane protein [Flavobacteriales bacterium]|nr:OmpH family outer membrane protein [Flavobacteriales bacterium]
MNKIITVLAIALISSTGISQKLGHLNSQTIMVEMPDYESAKKELELYRTEKTKELEMYQKLFQESLQNYEQEKGTLTADAIQRKETQLMEKQQKIEKIAYDAENEMQQKEQVLLQQIMKKVSEAVKIVADKNNYDYIFDLSSVLYAGGENIEDLVRKQLGLTTEK